MNQGAHEHDYGTGFDRRLHINTFHSEFFRRSDFNSVLSRPGDLYADALEYFNDPIGFFYAGDAVKRGTALVQQGSAQKAHGTVFGKIRFYASMKFSAAGHFKIYGVADGNYAVFQNITDFRQ